MLCLSLLAIGRKKAAVALLNARVEEILNIDTKVLYLQYLADITKIENYSNEIKYWMFISEWNQFDVDKVRAVPECVAAKLYQQVIKFRSTGASIQSGSFAETCLMDHDEKPDLRTIIDFGALLFQAVARAGLICEIIDTTHSKQCARWEEKTLKEIQKMELPFNGELFQNVEFLRKLVHLASYEYLVGNEARTITMCKEGIRSIDDFKMNNYKLELDGLLVFEVETLAMMALDYVDTTVSNEDLDLFLQAIVCKETSIRDTNDQIEPREYLIRNKYLRSPLRESKVFASCGHIHRVKATALSYLVRLIIDGGSKSATILNRDLILEAARKYIIAATMDAYDHPLIVKRYDQAIWCLLLAGGIDLSVLKLLFDVRNFHQTNLFFTYAEAEGLHALNKLNMSWPQHLNQFEILNIILDRYELFGHQCIEKRLSPTVLECHEKFYISETYLPNATMFTQTEKYLVTASQKQVQRVSRTIVMKCFTESRKLARLWYDAYFEAYKTIPEDLNKFFYEEIMGQKEEKREDPVTEDMDSGDDSSSQGSEAPKAIWIRNMPK